MRKKTAQTKAVAEALLPWYDRHGRHLPWRVKEGANQHENNQPILANPYHVWMSEVMLQQTTVATVGAYFAKFIKKWPTIYDLAKAEQEEVLAEWAGLGYYARARNLHKCAEQVVTRFDGQFPADEALLKSLPGIGEYTAAAIAAIAFSQPTAPVDGNIERVFTRLHRLAEPLPKVKATVKAMLEKTVPTDRNHDYVQALMDLGAGICTPTKPKCLLCPLKQICDAHEAGDEEKYPVKAAKKQKPLRHAIAYVWADEDSIYLPKRPQKGMLAGMREVPTSEWVKSDIRTSDLERLFKQGPRATDTRDGDILFDPSSVGEWQMIDGVVRHTFTHFHFEVKVAVCRENNAKMQEIAAFDPKSDVFSLNDLEKLALPTVMMKIIKHALMK